MRFFDCNTWIGKPTNAGASCATAESLLEAMDRAGIERALVWHIAQFDYEPLAGNEMLAEAIAPHPRLVGAWTIVPTQTGELGRLDEWLARAGQARIRALRAFPAANRYLLRGEVVGDILGEISERRIPLMLSLGRGLTWEGIYNLLSQFPRLTLVICDLDIWPSDRFFRPLLERFENVYVETSNYLADGGIEALVSKYGAKRILFGTGFPECYHGSAMLALGRAEIAESAKQAIAAGNLERLISEARW